MLVNHCKYQQTNKLNALVMICFESQINYSLYFLTMACLMPLSWTRAIEKWVSKQNTLPALTLQQLGD